MVRQASHQVTNPPGPAAHAHPQTWLTPKPTMAWTEMFSFLWGLFESSDLVPRSPPEEGGDTVIRNTDLKSCGVGNKILSA